MIYLKCQAVLKAGKTVAIKAMERIQTTEYKMILVSIQTWFAWFE